MVGCKVGTEQEWVESGLRHDREAFYFFEIRFIFKGFSQKERCSVTIFMREVSEKVEGILLYRDYISLTVYEGKVLRF